MQYFGLLTDKISDSYWLQTDKIQYSGLIRSAFE